MRRMIVPLMLLASLYCYPQHRQSYSTTLSDGPVAYAGPDTTICSGDCLTLDSAFAANYSGFLWIACGDGTFSEPFSLHPTYCPGQADIQTGSVTLVLTVIGSDSFVPATDSIVITIIDCNTGINESQKEKYFKVYPNPSRAEVFIENPGNESVQILYPDGRLIWEHNHWNAAREKIFLPKGIFFVISISKGKIRVIRLIIN